MALTHFGQIGFNAIDEPRGIIAMVACFQVCYQSSFGPLMFTHIYETCLPSVQGFMNTWLFVLVIAHSFLALQMLEKLGSDVVFLMYGILSIICFVLISVFTENTTFRDQKAGNRIVESSKEAN